MNTADKLGVLSKALGHTTAAVEALDEAFVALCMAGQADDAALRIERTLAQARAIQVDLEARVKDVFDDLVKHPGA